MYLSQENEHLNETDRILDALEDYLKEHPDALPQKQGELILPARMVDCGTKMTVRLLCYHTEVFAPRMQPNASLIITHNCHAPDAKSETYPLAFRPEGDVYVQDIEITFSVPGNTKIEYYVNGQKLMRTVAVIAPGYMAVIPWVGLNEPFVDEALHKYDIAGDYWMYHCAIKGTPEDIVSRFRPFLEGRNKYGDRTACFFNGRTFVPNAKNDNLYDLDPKIQERGIRQLDRQMRLLGYDGMELAASYTPDSVAIDILEEIGVKGLTSLCAWQNWRDGDWQINHCGVSNQPYYPAHDDFRKAGKQRKIMCFTMGNATCNRNYSIFALDGCPSNVVPEHRYRSDCRIIHHSIQRFYDTFDGYLADAKNNDSLLTITVAIESFRGFMDWQAVNDLALQYMVRRAATEKIVFTSAADVSDYHKQHALNLQPAYFFQPDYYYGYHDLELPGRVDDRIEVDTPEYLAVIRRGQGLPMYFYDYTVPWKDSNFGDGNRSFWGGVNPDTHDPSESAPTQVDRSDMTIQSYINADRVIIRIHSETAKKRMVTGVFDLPFESDCTVTADKADVKVKKLLDRWTQNTHLFVDLGSVEAGDSTVVLSVTGTPRVPISAELIRKPLAAMWFGDHAYLRSLTRDSAIRVRMEAPEGAYAQYIDGTRAYAGNGMLTFTLNSQWEDEAPILMCYSKSCFERALETAEVQTISQVAMVHYPLSARWFGDHAYLRSLDRRAILQVRMKAPKGVYVLDHNGMRVYEKDGILTFTVDGRREEDALRLRHYPDRDFERALAEADIQILAPND